MKEMPLILLLAVAVSGCATIVHTPTMSVPSRRDGVYHEVVMGQTLWRISKLYEVNLEELARVNRLEDVRRLRTGQVLFIPGAEKVIEKDKARASPETNTFIWPVDGVVISRFGSKKENVKNKGVDILAREAIAVRASKSGRVVFSDEHVRGYGKTVIINHGDEYQTVYAHNSEILVSLGDEVRQNQTIAKVGRSGRTTRPVLHFEIRNRGRPQNPLYYLP